MPRSIRTPRAPWAASLVLALAAAAGCVTPAPPDAAEVVVLLHGLARTSLSMQPLEASLERAGFAVVNHGYPSLSATPDELVADLESVIASLPPETATIHFVTHSLGGILVRAYLSERPLDRLGRVVMLAPPNRGSEIVDALGDSALFGWIFGPTARQLGTDADSLPNRLPPADFELGVIAGTESVNPLGEALIERPSDGTVALEATKVPGMTDFIALPSSHSFIMLSDETARQTIFFLRQGRFDHPPAGDQARAPGGRRKPGSSYVVP